MDNWMENFQFYPPPLYTHDSIIHFLLKQVLWLNTKSCMRVFSIMLMYLGFGWFRKHEKTLRGLDFFQTKVYGGRSSWAALLTKFVPFISLLTYMMLSYSKIKEQV